MEGEPDVIKWVFSLVAMREGDVREKDPTLSWDKLFFTLQPRILFSLDHTLLGFVARLWHMPLR